METLSSDAQKPKLNSVCMSLAEAYDDWAQTTFWNSMEYSFLAGSEESNLNRLKELISSYELEYGISEEFHHQYQNRVKLFVRISSYGILEKIKQLNQKVNQEFAVFIDPDDPQTIEQSLDNNESLIEFLSEYG